MASVPSSASVGPSAAQILAPATPVNGASSKPARSGAQTLAASQAGGTPLGQAGAGTAASAPGSGFQSCIETALGPAETAESTATQAVPTETDTPPATKPVAAAMPVLAGVDGTPAVKGAPTTKVATAPAPARPPGAAARHQATRDAGETATPNAAPSAQAPAAAAPLPAPDMAPRSAAGSPDSPQAGNAEVEGECGTNVQQPNEVAAKRAGARGGAAGPVSGANEGNGNTDAAPPVPVPPVPSPPVPSPETAFASPKPAPSLIGQAIAAAAAPASPAPTAEAGRARGPAAIRAPDTPAQPAAQVAPVLVSLGAAPGGSHRLTVRLDPAELGQVQIQIDRAHDASATVRITAERPETLGLLMRDQHDLHRALDQAGVPAAGRALSFQLADQAASSPNNAWSGNAGQSFNGSTGNGSGQARNGRTTPWQSGSGSEDSVIPRAMQAFARSGLDITA